MLKSVVIILVSNNILSGKRSSRIHEFLIQQLILLQLNIKKLVFINESVHELVHELNVLSKKYDFLLVVSELKSDIVFKALGNYCCGDMKINNGLRQKIDTDDLAVLPSSAKLLSNANLPYPVIYLQRIFILKEEFLEIQFFYVLKSYIEQYTADTIFTKIIQVQMNGNSKTIIEHLKKLANVEFQNHNSISTLTVSSGNFEEVVDCEKMLKNELHDNFIHSYQKISVLKRIYESNDEFVLKSLQVIDRCLSSYGPENTFLSFNGGKDCTVLLHLVYTVLKIKYPDYKEPIFCLYVKSQEGFNEQDTFISQCETFYNLNVMVVTSSIKQALKEVMSKKPHLKACFMGTRRTDPFSHDLKTFQMTDSDWPQLMRVSPLLEWHYSDIWDYLLFYKVPYCKLYDLGYTSIGSAVNTIRNPSLLFYDMEQGKYVYLPAYKLINEAEERSGRNAKL